MTEANTTTSVSLKLLVLVAVLVVFAVVIVVLVFFLCLRGSRSWKRRKLAAKHSSGSIPLVSKEIMVVRTSDLTPATTSEIGDVEGDPKKEAGMKVEIGAVTAVMKSEVSGGGAHRSEVSVEDPNIGWGRWYSMKEVELATRGFAEGNVIGEGGYGVVYRGIMHDASVVAVKNLLNNKYVTYSHV